MYVVSSPNYNIVCLDSSSHSKNVLHPLPSPPLGHLIAIAPVLAIADPVLLARDLVLALGEPPRHVLLPLGLPLSPHRPLLLLHPILLRGGAIVLAVFHRALVGPEPGVRRRQQGSQSIG